MRITVLLTLAAAILVAACADDRPTSPVSSPGARSSLATGTLPSATASGPSAQGKPVDHVGFTTVTRVIGSLAVVNVGVQNQSLATCPAGSTLVGGGYQMKGFESTHTPPWITQSSDNTAQGWVVDMVNSQPGGGVVSFNAFAYCAS